MTDEKTCYNCGNKNCNVYYSMVKKDYKRHFEIYEYNDFDCVNHNKWKELKELKVEEIRTDNTETLKNALDRIKELEEQLNKAKELIKNIIRVTWGEGWNYSLDWKVKAEQFLLGSN